MSQFRTPIDIANRACQHCGVRRIDTVQGFAENHRNAKEIGSVFDKLRRAELEERTWRFSIFLAVLRPVDTDTMLLAPAGWVSTTTYFVGMVVEHENVLWMCHVPNSLGAEPGALGTIDWQIYCGPMTADLWDEDIAYTSGELVYTADGDGTNRVYLSLQNANDDDPATATAWDAAVTYNKNQVVTYLSVTYMSLIDLNLGQVPSFAPAPWDESTSYNASDTVAGSDGVIYSSLGSGNTGFDPVTDAGAHWLNTGTLVPWSATFVGGAGSIKWRQIGGAEFPNGVTLTTLDTMVYPLGSGPSSQSGSKNVFRLPANYVKYAPQDPKAGSHSWLGAPTERQYDDWDFQDQYIVSSETGPITFRFAADVADVRLMNAMFCEGLGARIALAVCEILTQSDSKLGKISQIYNKFISDARQANAIEIGPIEQPLDEWLACRN